MNSEAGGVRVRRVVRVSGNLAQTQRVRFMVETSECRVWVSGLSQGVVRISCAGCAITSGSR